MLTALSFLFNSLRCARQETPPLGFIFTVVANCASANEDLAKFIVLNATQMLLENSKRSVGIAFVAQEVAGRFFSHEFRLVLLVQRCNLVFKLLPVDRKPDQAAHERRPGA